MAVALGTQKVKLAIAGVLLVAAAGVIYWRGGNPDALPDRITMVCAATGERFEVPRSRVTFLPADNPKTGQATLLPAYEKDGVWLVSGRYRSVLEQLGEQNRMIDLQTMQVRASP